MAALSKAEYMELEEELDEEQKKLLDLLADAHRRNPQDSWVDFERLDAWLGEVLHGTANLPIFSLRIKGLVNVNRNNTKAAISQKGLSYVKFYRKESGISQKRFGKIFWVVLIFVILLGMVLIIPTHDARMLIVSVVGSLIVWGVQVLYNHYSGSN